MTLEPRARDTQLRPGDHRLATDRNESCLQDTFIIIRGTPVNGVAVAGVAGAQVAVAGVGGHGDAGARLLLLVGHAAADAPDHLRQANCMNEKAKY